MSEKEVVKVALPSELLDSIRKAVDTGDYATTGEVIRGARHECRARQPTRQAEVDRLKAAWQDGIESGVSAPLDIDAVKSAAQQRFAQRSANSIL